MIAPQPNEVLVRAAALYLPVAAATTLALLTHPDRRRVTGALLATAWNVPTLLAVNVVAVRAGWWDFGVSTVTVAAVPADLWIGWALLWGAVPILATTTHLARAAGCLVALDLVLMPLAEPVVVLDSSWPAGQALTVAVCLVPGLLLGGWTTHEVRLRGRVVLQVLAFTGLLLYVVPSLAFTLTDEGWEPLLGRPRWQLVLAAVVLAPVAAMGIQAVRDFAAHGGTPVPLDPPKDLVTSGPYAYVGNPMQLSGTILIGAWGLLLTSPMIVATAPIAAVFSSGLAAWSEDVELDHRFGGEWRAYRARVHLWLPRWRPAVLRAGKVFVAETCEPCRDVGRFLKQIHPSGLDVRAAEGCPLPLQRITYVRGATTSEGIAAIGRSLEHVNLAWAAASWIARLPAVERVLVLIGDAVGGAPRSIPTASPPYRRSDHHPSTPEPARSARSTGTARTNSRLRSLAP
jgi:protein-S-isoprenylcysteine O-methyltransferase Ste14